jgi:hypothetical protein
LHSQRHRSTPCLLTYIIKATNRLASSAGISEQQAQSRVHALHQFIAQQAHETKTQHAATFDAMKQRNAAAEKTLDELQRRVELLNLALPFGWGMFLLLAVTSELNTTYPIGFIAVLLALYSLV